MKRIKTTNLSITYKMNELITMNEQLMIDYIYSVIANKTIQFWTIIENREWERLLHISWAYAFELQWWSKIAYTDYVNQIKWYKIIWNPVNIWDVLHWIDINKNWPDWSGHIISVCDLWTWKNIGIEWQTKKCIEFIYNLIQWN